MVKRIVAGSPGPDVLDVGCGTGIAARQFQAAGCRVLGVEPDVRMADLARQLGVEVDVATFEAWDPASREFDAVVAGQAWHWIDPVAGAAKAAQVLRPGGRLAAFWNVFQLPPDVAEAFAAVYQRVMPDSPFNLQAMTKQALDGYSVLFTKAADGIREVGGFSDPEQWRFDWEWSYTRDTWLDQMPTLGTRTQLPPDKLAEVLEGVGAAIDAMGGSFTMCYATVAVTVARTGAACPGLRSVRCWRGRRHRSGRRPSFATSMGDVGSTPSAACRGVGICRRPRGSRGEPTRVRSRRRSRARRQ